ncbi:hypothetical protein JCM5353_000718, partial [Sporobolomyces roseus]
MALTSHDTRGHLRGDSIAQKRNTPKKSRTLTSSGSPGGVINSSSRPGSASDTASGFNLTPNLAIRIIVGSLLLFSILHFSPSLFGTSNGTPSVSGKDRKALLDGSGEAWILPKR